MCFELWNAALMNRAESGGWGLLRSGRIGFRRETLALALLHVLIVLRRAGPWRGVRRQAAEPLRDVVAGPVGDLFIDGAATGQSAGEEQEGRDDGQRAKTDEHLRSVWAFDRYESRDRGFGRLRIR
jgi:hypothetical protein